MAITTTTRKVTFVGNDTSTVFPFNFKVFVTSDLVVVQEDLEGNVTTLALGTDYTAALNANQDVSPGGSITLLNGPLSTGDILAITSGVQELQEVVLTNLGGFFPDVLNSALDKVTILTQQLQIQADSSIQFPLTDADMDNVLPPAAQRTNSFPYFGGDGNLSLVKGSPSGEVGPAPNLAIGDVTSPDEASASITGTNPNYQLNLGLPRGTAGAQGPPISFKGAYSSGTTYALGDGVYASDGSSYSSLVAGNVGHDPTSSPTQWSKYAQAGQVTNADLMAAGGYTSTLNGPPSNVADTTAVTINGKVYWNWLYGNPSTLKSVGPIKTINVVHTIGTGTFTLLIAVSTTIVYRADIQAKGSGLQTYIAGVDFPDFTCALHSAFGIIPTSTADVTTADSDSGHSGYHAQTVDPGDVGSTISGLSLAGGLGQISLQVEIATIDIVSSSTLASATAPLTAITSKTSLINKRRTLLYETPLTGTSAPSGWHTGYPGTSDLGDWTFDNGIISPATVPSSPNHQFYTEKVEFSVRQKTCRIRFSILATPTTFAVGTLNTDSLTDSTGGTNITVDSAASTLNLLSWNNTLISTEALGFTMTTGVSYLLEMTFDGRELTITLADPVSGIVCSLLAGDNTTDHGGNPAWGNFFGAPAFFSKVGQWKVTECKWFCNQTNIHTYVIGDSITYAVGVLQSQGYSSLFAASAETPTAVSGYPGCMSDSALKRIKCEAALLTPDQVICFIGTNDAGSGADLTTFGNNLTAIVNAVHTWGGRIIMGLLIPWSYTSTVQANYNAKILACGADGFVHFDLAMSLGRDGMTADSSLHLSGTNYHPNVDGHAAMASQLMIDQPDFYD